MSRRICVLGGGVVGVATAYYLVREGHRVTVLERAETAGQGASFANGGQLSYSYVAPLADPSVLTKLPAWLLTRESPLQFAPQADPAQWRWALAFLKACNAVTSRQATAELLALGLYSRELVHHLVQDETIAFDYARNGKLVLYRSPGEFESAKRQMEFQATLGCVQRALSPAACVTVEPALAHLESVLAGGIYTPSEDAGDCHKFTTELARIAAARYGATFAYGCTIQSLIPSSGRIAAVRTSTGDVEADDFVVALGMASVRALKPLGLSLPLYPINGYSLTAPVGPEHTSPKVSITDSHHKIVYALLGGRFRAAGMADISGANPKPDPRRLALFMRQARETFPNAADYDRASTWFAPRPATPTGKPLLGATPVGNLWLNVGQGALGFTLACGSAKLVADSIAGRAPALDLAPFSWAQHALGGLRAA